MDWKLICGAMLIIPISSLFLCSSMQMFVTWLIKPNLQVKGMAVGVATVEPGCGACHPELGVGVVVHVAARGRAWWTWNYGCWMGAGLTDTEWNLITKYRIFQTKLSCMYMYWWRGLLLTMLTVAAYVQERLSKYVNVSVSLSLSLSL